MVERLVLGVGRLVQGVLSLIDLIQMLGEQTRGFDGKANEQTSLPKFCLWLGRCGNYSMPHWDTGLLGVELSLAETI